MLVAVLPMKQIVLDRLLVPLEVGMLEAQVLL